MIQKILCPTDLTLNSLAGIVYGLTLARENRAQLIVFSSQRRFPASILITNWNPSVNGSNWCPGSKWIAFLQKPSAK